MNEQLARVEGHATSRDGAVSVAAAPGGAVTRVVFAASVREADPGALGSVVQHAIAAAQADVARKQAEIVRASLGSTEALDQVLAEDRRLFGDKPTAPGPGPQPALAPTREREAEDDGFSVLSNRQEPQPALPPISQPPPPAPPSAQPTPPARPAPRAPREDDPEDEGGFSVFDNPRRP
jgi:DNA-binding protein YbaB